MEFSRYYTKKSNRIGLPSRIRLNSYRFDGGPRTKTAQGQHLHGYISRPQPYYSAAQCPKQIS